jgi:ubiquinone/menaquinone biosynthesis C-methylase UbiE
VAVSLALGHPFVFYCGPDLTHSPCAVVDTAPASVCVCPMTVQKDSPGSLAIPHQQKTWRTGDFNVLAKSFIGAAEALVQTVDPRPNQRVLDVACGSGNVALIVARRYCTVTGIDYVPRLVERARQRAAADGVDVDFEEGDAHALRFADATFDMVLSTFGVMFAPNQDRAAAELLRVCRPGGIIGLANWMPTEFGGEVFGTVDKYVPPDPGVKHPTRWGTDAGVRELLGAGAASIRTERRTFTQHFHDIDHAVEVFQTYFGPTARAHEMSDDAARERLRADLAEIFRRYNRASDGTVALECAYLQVVATRR